MKPVVRQARAEQDLEDIWQYLADFSEAAADRTLDELERRGQQLSILPHLGRPRPDIASDARGLLCGNYIVLYRLWPDRIEIMRYVHQSRDLKGLL